MPHGGEQRRGRGHRSRTGGPLASTDDPKEVALLALVTGAAGFIGSTLVDALLEQGHDVRAIDCLTPYYDVAAKEGNLASALERGAVLHRVDLRHADLDPLLDGVDVVFHQAGQPGVRLSWDEHFADYDSHNVLATQRVLEAGRRRAVGRVVYASSSSIYGDAAQYPSLETHLPAPHSPYGVTKLAGEHLCSLYAANWGLSTMSLRYFTVYGPRQRPDMATHRLIEAALDGTPFPLYGDGSQQRDFTFVDDIVAANLAAAGADIPAGTVANVAGGSSVTMAELLDLVGEAVGRPVLVDRLPAQPGDVRRTGGSIDRATTLLGWRPRVTLADGIARQADWHRRRRAAR